METHALKNQNGVEQAWRVLRRRWMLILLCVVLVTGAAIGFSVIQQKKYTSSSSLLFENAQFSQELFGANFIQPTFDPTQEQATNLSLASLPAVASRTAAALDLSGTLVLSEVSVSEVGQSNLVRISVTDHDPVRAAQIANMYAHQYVIFREEADRAKIAGARKLVKRQLATLTPQQRAGSVGQQLQNRANQLGVLAALQTGNAEVVQSASVPKSPSSPKTTRNSALGLLLGALLGIGLAFLAERLDHRVRDPSEFEQIYGVPVLTAVPESSALAALKMDQLPTRDLESFALLRTRLRYFNVDRSVRSLLVTSAAPGEGKSTVALNLALAEALTGERRVLLFEADLRRPSLARRLGISTNAPGTAEVVSGNASLEEALGWVELPRMNGNDPDVGFSILTAGSAPPNPIELLSSQSLVRLLSRVTEQFDVVVVDSPPMTLVSDAIPVVQEVSGVLVVTRMGETTRSMARHTADQLKNLNAPILGIVVNAVRRSDRAYYYGSGDQYYGDRQKRKKETRQVRRRGRTARSAGVETRFNAENAEAEPLGSDEDWAEYQRTAEFELKQNHRQSRSRSVKRQTQPNWSPHEREPAWVNEEVHSEGAEQEFEADWSGDPGEPWDARPEPGSDRDFPRS